MMDQQAKFTGYANIKLYANIGTAQICTLYCFTSWVLTSLTRLDTQILLSTDSLHYFIEVDSTLRLVIATTAFGMMIDCPNIRWIYHFGFPDNLEEYVQETGRAGRDGDDAEAILFRGSGEKHANESMKVYASNEHECRRLLLFSNFLKFYRQDVKLLVVNAVIFVIPMQPIRLPILISESHVCQ